MPPSLGKDASGSRTPCKREGGARPVLTTPEATIGFIAPGATPPLQRAGKAVAFASPDEEDAPVIIDFAAARRSTAGRLLIGRLLSSYPADPDAIVRDLRGPWRIRGEVTVQRVVSGDGRFILHFAREGDRLHVLRAGPWHYHNDGVIFAPFDGTGNASDVRLDSIRVWAQIQGLPYELKSEEMGRELGKKLVTVIAVAHKNKLIVDKHLRVRVDMPVHRPIKSYITATPTGTSNVLKYFVKYEKLPNFCFCCGLLGHTTEKFCSIPKEQRTAVFSSDIKALPIWKERSLNSSAQSLGPVRRSLEFEGMLAPGELEKEEETEKLQAKVPDVVINVVTTAVKQLMVSPVGETSNTAAGRETSGMNSAPVEQYVAGAIVNRPFC